MKRCVPSVIGAVICAAFTLSCGRSTANVPAPIAVSGPLPPGVPQVRATAVVISRKGKVELQRGTEGGWADAQVGDRLAPSDALRTQAGEAEVGVTGVKMRVHEASAVRLKDAKDSWLRAQVRERRAREAVKTVEVFEQPRCLRERALLGAAGAQEDR